MIKHIQIKDYKCLHDENLEIKPFTIVTGVNSAGKSSLIQSVLLPVRRIGKNGQILLDTIVNLSIQIRLEISIIMQKVSGVDIRYR